MKHGFIKVGVASPHVKVADTEYNVQEHVRLTKAADEASVHVLCFPELSLVGASANDLYLQSTLISGAERALVKYLEATKHTSLLSVVGVPYRFMGRLYNCAAFCLGGKLLGLVPKTHLQTGIPVNELRAFSSSEDIAPETVDFHGEKIPFGTDLLFSATNLPSLSVASEIGSDVRALIPPSVYASAAGATVICHPAADVCSVTSKAAQRQALSAHSKSLRIAYLHAAAGRGESTTDYVFGGENAVLECGERLLENDLFASDLPLLITEIDTERIQSEKARAISTGPCVSFRTVPFSLPFTDTHLTRVPDAHPFMPTCPSEQRARCEEILSIQARGLAERIERAYAKTLVIGISGGLDSTLALLCAVRALELLGRSPKEILAVTMPCFGTTKRTKTNAVLLCEQLGVTLRTVDILNAVNQHFSDIGHDPSVRDVTYENSQARERTQILMDLANETGGMVIGTGDLSELALGFATYNGDHMSMYGVNASVPKTVIRHVVAHCAMKAREGGNTVLSDTLLDILDTPVSPELLPADSDDQIAQKTEDLVGPYELHDYYLFYMLRYGFSPSKLYRMARVSFADVYDDETLKKWLKIFLRRFFSQQFRRSCLPDGPAVGSVALSPRTSFSMPSDASAALWMAEVDAL